MNDVEPPEPSPDGRGRRRLFGAGLALLALGGTGIALTPANAETAPAAGTRSPSLAFAACTGLPPGSPPLECASFDVPLDYANPYKGTIKIAVARAKAKKPADRLGSVIFNPGGPGGPGAATVARAATNPSFAALNERFDLIGFDPRGIGRSNPLTACRKPGEALNAVAAERVREPVGPGIRRALGLGQEFARNCQAANAALLPYLGTGYVADDMDVLREKLGEDKLNFLGFSYGTILGNVYADRYPDRVRTMVLDGGISPRQWRDDPLSLLRDENLASEAALGRFFEWCASTPKLCTFGDGDPAAAFDRLLARLDGPSVRDAAGVPQVNAAGLLYGLLNRFGRGKADWPAIAQLLDRLDRGESLPLSSVASGPESRTEPGSDANIAISCIDWAGTYGPRAFARYARFITTAAPRFGASSALGPPLVDTTLAATCATWPVKNPPSRHTGDYRAQGSPPILVIGTTGDPSTPYRGAVAQARNLAQGRLLTFVGEGHIAFDKSKCANAAAVSYLITATPPRTRVCTDDVEPAAMPTTPPSRSSDSSGQAAGTIR